MKDLPDPVMPSSVWYRSPASTPAASCAIAFGWSPAAWKSDTSSNSATRPPYAGGVTFIPVPPSPDFVPMYRPPGRDDRNKVAVEGSWSARLSQGRSLPSRGHDRRDRSARRGARVQAARTVQRPAGAPPGWNPPDDRPPPAHRALAARGPRCAAASSERPIRFERRVMAEMLGARAIPARSSHRCAARLHGLSRATGRVVELTVPRGAASSGEPGCSCHTSTVLPAHHVGRACTASRRRAWPARCST